MKRHAPDSLETFAAAHRATAETLTAYQTRGRKGSVRLGQTVLDERSPQATKHLYANNTEARIQFTKLVTERVEELGASAGADDMLFFWTTLAPKQFVVPEHAAASFDPR